MLVGGQSVPVRSEGNRFRVWKCSFQRQNTNAVQVAFRGLFSQFLPFSIPNDGGVDLREIYRAECVLESQPTLNSRDVSVLPKLIDGTEILDNRFSDRFKESVLGQKPVLSYPSSNGTWLPASEAEVQTNLVVIQAAMAKKRRQEIVGPIVFGGVFFFALFPVIYFVVKRRRLSN